MGLRLLKRGSDKSTPVPCDKNDVFVEELEKFAAAVRGGAKPEMDGDSGTTSLAVLRAGTLSAKEGRCVEVAEVLKNDQGGWNEVDGTIPVIAGALIALGYAAAQAQDHLARTITVVVPFPAGGPSDVVARIVVEHMSRTARPDHGDRECGGAGGTIGSGARRGRGAERLQTARRQHGLACRRAGADAEHQVRALAISADRPRSRPRPRLSWRARRFRPTICASSLTREADPAATKQAHGGIGVSSHMACVLFNTSAALSRRRSPIAAPVRRRTTWLAAMSISSATVGQRRRAGAGRLDQG